MKKKEPKQENSKIDENFWQQKYFELATLVARQQADEAKRLAELVDSLTNKTKRKRSPLKNEILKGDHVSSTDLKSFLDNNLQ